MNTIEHDITSDKPLSINIKNVLAHKHLIIYLDQCDMKMVRLYFLEKALLYLLREA